MSRISTFGGIILTLGLALGALPAQAKNSQFSAETGALCRSHIGAVEKHNRIPRHLLSAVSLAESGRWHARTQESFAWPWTVTSGKRTFYLANKEAAIAQVKHLRSHGVSNIDVGCMQVNLHYHPKAFDSLEEAFDPAVNVAYAAKFLLQLHAKTRSWPNSVARYHSATPSRGKSYFAKVSKLWLNERHRFAAERRREITAAYEIRKAERLAKRRVDKAARARAKLHREASLGLNQHQRRPL